jgi:hypothetical protein
MHCVHIRAAPSGVMLPTRYYARSPNSRPSHGDALRGHRLSIGQHHFAVGCVPAMCLVPSEDRARFVLAEIHPVRESNEAASQLVDDEWSGQHGTPSPIRVQAEGWWGSSRRSRRMSLLLSGARLLLSGRLRLLLRRHGVMCRGRYGTSPAKPPRLSDQYRNTVNTATALT